MEGQLLTAEEAGQLPVGSKIRLHNGPVALRGCDLWVIGHYWTGGYHPTATLLPQVARHRDAPAGRTVLPTRWTLTPYEHDRVLVEVIWVPEQRTEPA